MIKITCRDIPFRAALTICAGVSFRFPHTLYLSWLTGLSLRAKAAHDFFIATKLVSKLPSVRNHVESQISDTIRLTMIYQKVRRSGHDIQDGIL